MSFSSQYQAGPSENQKSLESNEAYKSVYFHFVYLRPPVLPGPPVQVLRMKNKANKQKQKQKNRLHYTVFSKE